ncbi:PD-(D/E)XK nuclease family protein [Allorhodopirellula heiligendammensis]|uniref:PD-(D/E)XK nuclease family protein n=1 Tax=Allorhodopirellula heiligendammensis TaxID=2714739 RepID=UPI0011B5B1DA|nr:PD-(D/E)XK nuclease family protein [Allorhodopirellula heiligendammensis]
MDRIVGGPIVLLEWLETQLGLPQADVHRASRVMQYADALEKVPNACFSPSLEADKWETASELLKRRDELMLSGWDGSKSDGCPPITRDLATAEKEYRGSFPGDAERLAMVFESLNAGQVLPRHELKLYEVIDVWPALWQAVLERMNICPADEVLPLSTEVGSLHAAGCVVRGNTMTAFGCDESLRIAKARSETVATELVASVLSEDHASHPDKVARTVVLCEDDSLAVRLDTSLLRRGVPTMGASVQTKAHPVLQVLPLALELCWDPVDPQCLLDLLTLPVIPFRRPIASRLARALAEEPGLGSAAWDHAFEEICAESEQDIENPGRMKQRLQDWFCTERSPADQPIATTMVAGQCRKVAKWAIGRATLIWNDESRGDSDNQVAIALHEASRQASLLGDLVELAGETITQPQLGRLLDEVMDRGVESRPCPVADGGPTRVRSLSEIADGYDRLIWLGTTTTDATGSCWSVKQLNDFAAAGIHLDDGTHNLRSLRAAEARGLCLAKESMLVVALPASEEQRVHPLWLAIEQKIADHHHPDHWSPPAIEDLVANNDCAALAPFVFRCESVSTQPAQPQRPVWEIPASLLKDRDTVSASELEDRLACPLKWTFRYQAGLRSSEIASLPDEFQLRGNLFHKILERVFAGDGSLPDATEAVRLVESTFNERLPLDAAPLAQPEKRVESQRLRNELVKATRLFVETLSRGGYTSVKIEEPITGTAFGKEMRGWIDCVASADDGREAVVDFKYAGRAKFYGMITEGRSVQLATYAHSRRQTGGNFPAVAYLVLSDGKFFTPSGSPLAGVDPATVLDGPSIERVWNNFSRAITDAEDWLSTDAAVPARPLQVIDDWPDGADIVLKEKLKRDESQSVCRYCDYTKLCGKEAVQ